MVGPSSSAERQFSAGELLGSKARENEREVWIINEKQDCGRPGNLIKGLVSTSRKRSRLPSLGVGSCDRVEPGYDFRVAGFLRALGDRSFEAESI